MSEQGVAATNSHSFWDKHLVRWSAVATIVGLAVAVYFGIKAKDKRAIEIAYLGKLSLITTEPSYADRLSIRYGTQDVRGLTKLGVRISNSGGMPIERRDVEQPITFPFSSGKILEAGIVEKFPTHLQAEISFKSNQVTVSNGLLNPNDFMRVEILCEGDPGWPKPNFRITGIADATVVVPDVSRPVRRVALFEFPKPFQFVLLTLVSLIPAFLFIGAPIALVSSVANVFKKIPDMTAIIDDVLDAKKLVESRVLLGLGEEFGAYAWLLYNTHPSKWFDDVAALEDLIRARVPTGKQSKLVAQEIQRKLRANFPEHIASALTNKLPSGQGALVRRRLRLERFEPDAKLDGILSQARAIAIEAAMPRTVWERTKLIDYGEFLGTLFLFFLGACGGLVLGASWLNLLGK